MKTGDLMERNVHTCRLEDSLAQAAETLLKEDVGALPVVDADDKLVGVITDRDICMSSLLEGRPLKDLPVSLAASAPAHACGVEDSLGSVLALMQTHQIHRVPVVDAERRVAGIFGLGDVVRAAEIKKSGATPKTLAQTLAAILEPREQTARTETSSSR